MRIVTSWLDSHPDAAQLSLDPPPTAAALTRFLDRSAAAVAA
jgi:hypothetical protein